MLTGHSETNCRSGDVAIADDSVTASSSVSTQRLLGDNVRGMLSDVSKFPPKSRHLFDCILTLSCLPFYVILCEPVNLILDSVGIYVRYHENGALTV